MTLKVGDYVPDTVSLQTFEVHYDTGEKGWETHSIKQLRDRTYLLILVFVDFSNARARELLTLMEDELHAVHRSGSTMSNVYFVAPDANKAIAFREFVFHCDVAIDENGDVMKAFAIEQQPTIVACTNDGKVMSVLNCESDKAILELCTWATHRDTDLPQS